MNFKQIIQDYFTFSRNERKGITILLVIIFLLGVANKVIFYFETPGKIDLDLLDSARNEMNLSNKLVSSKVNKLFRFDPNIIDYEALDSLSIPKLVKRNILKFREKGGVFNSMTDFRKIYGVTDTLFDQLVPFLIIENKAVITASEKNHSKLFYFDPNTASDEDFMKLGLTEKQIKTIRKFQSRGGSFRGKADFLKIYGISESQKNILAEFVTIKQQENIKYEKNMEVIEFQIEINTADSIELMKLPGIGDKLSKRIEKYRNLLGGFYSIEQLNEVYGLSDQIIQKMSKNVRIDPAHIVKVNLNFADWNELAKHPYIQKNLARQIVKFRTKYGSIQNPKILLDSMILNIEEFARLKPYL
jgi:DNA uptake protein ComE-like DNA-binding protein